MSSEWGYNAQEYQLILSDISNDKRLVVEGETDKDFFRFLFDELSKTIEIHIDNIEVFVTNNNFKIDINGVAGNRKKIECIHKRIKGSPKYTNVVFFIDREFDDFIIDHNKPLEDKTNSHKVDGQMVMSRGHSIENYLFDINVIRSSLRCHTEPDLFNKAIKLFEENFNSIIYLASAVSIALKESHTIQELEKTIDCELIDINPSNISLRIDDWKKRIEERSKKISPDKLEEVINLYKKWDKKIKSEQVDCNVIRWICHGHIGINIIFEFYCSCLLYCDKSKKDKYEIRKVKKEKIYKDFANWWASNSIQDKCLYPKEVLEKLGFNLKNMEFDA